jgi:hypothetical protein
MISAPVVMVMAALLVEASRRAAWGDGERKKRNPPSAVAPAGDEV